MHSVGLVPDTGGILDGRWFRPGAGHEVEAQGHHLARASEVSAAVVVRPDLVQGRLRGLAVLELHNTDVSREADLHVGTAAPLVHFRLERRLHELAQHVQHEVAVRLPAQLLTGNAG